MDKPTKQAKPMKLDSTEDVKRAIVAILTEILLNRDGDVKLRLKAALKLEELRNRGWNLNPAQPTKARKTKKPKERAPRKRRIKAPVLRVVKPPSHGHSKNGRKSPTMHSWSSMKDRCLNPNSISYWRYGGAGITIDPRWLGKDGFRNFLADMGERPEGTTLDRYPDNAGGYSPSNTRWATPAEQANNRRPRRKKGTITNGRVNITA